MGKGEGKRGGTADDGTGGGVLGSVAGAHELVVGSGPRDDAAKVGADGVEAVGLKGLVVLDDEVAVEFGWRWVIERAKVSIPACGIGEIEKEHITCVSQNIETVQHESSMQRAVNCEVRGAPKRNIACSACFAANQFDPSKQVLQAK